MLEQIKAHGNPIFIYNIHLQSIYLKLEDLQHVLRKKKRNCFYSGMTKKWPSRPVVELALVDLCRAQVNMGNGKNENWDKNLRENL